MQIAFDNTYARELTGAYTHWQPAKAPAPRLLFLNRDLAAELGLDPEALAGPDGLAMLSGNTVPAGAEPLAQVYAGHQFGGFSPQLGDGRALLLGEVINRRGQRRDIAFKGSGRTPYSRGGDGKAAVGPMLREVLIGEGMHALGIPTTRALAVVGTGEMVLREGRFPGALLTRVASSHLRVGTFQFFAARGEAETLLRLLDYSVARHDPDLAAMKQPGERALALLRAVAGRQAALLAQWMNVGFIHGVMNTDNMTISGETIDYGPCAFMEAYNPATVFSSIDHSGRYAYANQAPIARWNLARLAEALLQLMATGDNEAQVQEAVEQVSAVIDEFPALYAQHLLQGQRAKLGLQDTAAAADDTPIRELAESFLALLQEHQVDYTLAWRRLGDAAAGDANPLRALFAEPTAVNPWLLHWQARCSADDTADDTALGVDAATATATHARARARARAKRMNAVNPWIIPRNHHVETALAAASEDQNMVPFEQMLAALRHPFEEDLTNPALARYAEPASLQMTASYQTFCGT